MALSPRSPLQILTHPLNSWHGLDEYLPAITGIILKSIYFNALPEWAGLTLYLGLGWAGALSGYVLYRRSGFARIRLILLGALAYTAGAMLDIFRFPVLVPAVIGPHELFHIMVLIGIAAHWTHIHRIANAKLALTAGQASQTSPVTDGAALREKFGVSPSVTGAM